jgi:hypothetical protein
LASASLSTKQISNRIAGFSVLFRKNKSVRRLAPRLMKPQDAMAADISAASASCVT